MDQLSVLLSRHSFHGKVFFNDDFCGVNAFEEDGKCGHLHIVRNGQVTMRHEDGMEIFTDEPCIIFYTRGRNHRLCVPDSSSATLLCSRIHFDGGRHNPLARALPECLHVPLSNLPGLSGLLDILFREADASYPGQQLTLNRLCDVVVVQLMRHAYETGQIEQGTLSGLADESLARALVMMHENPGHPWTLHALAKVCGMSRSSFAKYFHEVVAVTPADYLSGRRMLLAQALLRKKKAVKTVAFEVGYASQPAFTKAFTARLGMSPSEWLKSTPREQLEP